MTDTRGRGLVSVPDVTGDDREDMWVETRRGEKSTRLDNSSYLLDRIEPGTHSIEDLQELRSLPGDGNAEAILQVRGSGDFDGDGARDLLLEHVALVDGDWVGYLFLGPTMDRVVLRSTLGQGQFHLGAVGDLDGDGMDSWVFVDWPSDASPATAWLIEGCGDG